MKVEIGNATLYLGDCMDVLPTLPKVDAVITDPPFEAEAHTDMRRSRKAIKTGTNDVIDFEPICENVRNGVAEWTAKNNNGWALFFCQVEAASIYRDVFNEHGAKYKRTMVWVKPDSAPQFNGQGPAQGYECISSIWCGNGASRWNGGGKRGVFEYCVTSGRFGGHPTEKPMPLMSDLIKLFSWQNNLILDPFMGSGTTGVAAIQLGRKFIGIEREERYFQIACQRIEQAVAQGQLFEPEPQKQIQEQLL
jgi:DNA modification methylase